MGLSVKLFIVSIAIALMALAWVFGNWGLGNLLPAALEP